MTKSIEGSIRFVTYFIKKAKSYKKLSVISQSESHVEVSRGWLASESVWLFIAL